MILEFIKFIIFSGLIVLISKYMLVSTLRKLAEGLKLKPKTVGNIAGIATSIPELLTVMVSSFSGFFNTSIFNVLSSNIINFIQYIFAIILNKNIKITQNKAIRIDILLVIITILIPLVIAVLEIQSKIYFVLIFLILYAIFMFLNNKVHKLYLEKEDKKMENIIENQEKQVVINSKKISVYVITIILIGMLLFIIGELLGNVLENLANIFDISEMILGILLGFVTSIPELITFFESQKHYKNKEKENILGVVEATNNLFTSNILNLFIIQSIGILIYTLSQ